MKYKTFLSWMCMWTCGHTKLWYISRWLKIPHLKYLSLNSNFGRKIFRGKIVDTFTWESVCVIFSSSACKQIDRTARVAALATQHWQWRVWGRGSRGCHPWWWGRPTPPPARPEGRLGSGGAASDKQLPCTWRPPLHLHTFHCNGRIGSLDWLWNFVENYLSTGYLSSVARSLD